MGKAIGGLVSSALSVFGVGKANDSAQREAAAAQERANQARAAAEQAQQNMQKNFAADLKLENVGQVVAGGTADAVAATDLLKKKKSASSGLASTLGINL